MRLIDADAVPYQSEIIADESGYMAEFDIAYKSDIDRQPTVEVERVVHAHWILDKDRDKLRCSACEMDKCIGTSYTRCPWCGAIMDEEVE